MSNPLTPGPPPDFRLEWYKLTRAHELELNKAALAYEHERLKFLAYANGGGAAAFLALVGAMAKDSTPDWQMAGAAVLAWVVGLVCAWCAWTLAHEGQSNYLTSYRMRRYTVELEHAAPAKENGPPAVTFGIEEKHPSARGAGVTPTASGLNAAADEWRSRASTMTTWAWGFATASIVLFAAGTTLAAWVVTKTGPVKSAESAVSDSKTFKCEFVER